MLVGTCWFVFLQALKVLRTAEFAPYVVFIAAPTITPGMNEVKHSFSLFIRLTDTGRYLYIYHQLHRKHFSRFAVLFCFYFALSVSVASAFPFASGMWLAF